MKKSDTLDRGRIATHCPRPSGAGEEAGGQAGWGLQVPPYEVETGEGGCSPLPVSPTPNGDIRWESVYEDVYSYQIRLSRNLADFSIALPE